MLGDFIRKRCCACEPFAELFDESLEASRLYPHQTFSNSQVYLETNKHKLLAVLLDLKIVKITTSVVISRFAVASSRINTDGFL
jgi:hypothetical protein